MLDRILSAASYLLIAFILLYAAWHMGRYHERLSYEPEQTNSQSRAYIRVYQELLNELQEPSSTAEWNGKYKQWEQEKYGSQNLEVK